MHGVTKRSEAAGDVGLMDWPDPEPRPGTVIVEVASVGICGTDLHIMRNEYSVTPPVIMGHEVCGRVIALGSDVDPALDGRRVVCETFFSTCRSCPNCRNGRPNLCPERRSIGSHVNGAMAPLVEVPAPNLHLVPDSLSDAAATLAEPVACVTNSLIGRGPQAEPGQPVLVIGPGPIGMLAAQVERAQGADVTLRGTDRDGARLSLAKSLGFEVSLAGDTLPEDRFEVVVECSGSAPGYSDALHFASRAGHVIQIGLSGRSLEVPTDLICYKELVVTSGFASTPRSWQRAMRLIRSGALDLEPMVTDVLPLARWESAFDRSFAADGMKFVLRPWGGA